MTLIKSLIAPILLLLLLSVFINAEAQELPRDFQFNFKLGFSKKDQSIFDSKSDSIFINVPDSILKFKINLSKDEKQFIYNELQKINFMSYPEKFLPQIPDTLVLIVGSPSKKFFLIVTFDSNSKLVDCIN